MQGEIDQALAKYDESIQIMQKIGDVRGIGILTSKLADVYWELGDLEKAEVLIQDALSVAESYGHLLAIAIRRYKLAEIFEAQNNIAKALVFYQKSLLIFRKLNMPEAEEVHQTIEFLSRLEDTSLADYGPLASRIRKALNENDFRKAILYQEKAIDIIRQAGENRSAQILLCTLLYDLARYNQVVGDFDKALSLFEEVTHIAEYLQLPNLDFAKDAARHARELVNESTKKDLEFARSISLARIMVMEAIDVKFQGKEVNDFLEKIDQILNNLAVEEHGSPKSDLKHFLIAVKAYLILKEILPVPFSYSSEYMELLAA